MNLSGSMQSRELIDDQNGDGMSSATRVSVITSTYSLEDSSKKHDSINTMANSTTPDEKAEARKPYGGRPLKYECPQCQRRFHAPSHLKRHVMSHSSERPFRCNVCNKGFLQAWHLGRHMTTHTGNKPFKCADCSKSFGSRFEMRTHINYIHKGIKEHKCDVCGKHFTLRSNLKVHMRKHTGEKPYQCNFCSKRFGQRGHLQYHIRKHEGKDDVLISQEMTKLPEKSSVCPMQKHGSVSEQSEVRDEDCECDSGIGGYDSEAESGSCSSPGTHDSNYDDQQNSWNAQKIDRPSSPEFGLPDKSRRSPLKRTLAELHMSDVKPYVCNPCNCGFAEAGSLRAHARHSHPRKGIMFGDYHCGYCMRDFLSVEKLQLHIDEHQQGGAIHLLDSQNKRFSDPKPRMSAKSLAFSIENICADSSPKNQSKNQLQYCQALFGSNHHKSLPRKTIIPSIPISCHLTSMNGYTVPHTIDCLFPSRLGQTCQCHLDIRNLQIH